MAFVLPKANAGGDAPTVEDGLVVLRFDDLVLKEHEDWAGTDQYGHADDGKRFHFQFTLLDAAHQVCYEEGDPIELEALTRTATGEKSNFAKILKGILTPAEFLAWQANEPFDGEVIKGRAVNGVIAHSTKGWPNVAQVISNAKPVKVKA